MSSPAKIKEKAYAVRITKKVRKDAEATSESVICL
jgi:hypothetical protein